MMSSRGGLDATRRNYSEVANWWRLNSASIISKKQIIEIHSRDHDDEDDGEYAYLTHLYAPEPVTR